MAMASTTGTLRESLKQAALRTNTVQGEAQKKSNPGVSAICGMASDRLKPLPKILNEMEEIERKISGLNEHKERMAGNADELLRTDREIKKEQDRIGEGVKKIESELRTITSLLDGAQKRL